jgi:hypothetical protein
MMVPLDYGKKSLILLVPAIYTSQSYTMPFNQGFTDDPSYRPYFTSFYCTRHRGRDRVS